MVLQYSSCAYKAYRKNGHPKMEVRDREENSPSFPFLQEAGGILPASSALLPADVSAVLQAPSHSGADEILQQRAPMEKTGSSGLFRSFKSTI